MAILGGIKDVPVENNLELEGLARYAIEEYNKKENKLLVFIKLVKAKEQIVAGIMYYLTLEASEGCQKKCYEAKIWVKHWENFKQLQEFKHVDGLHCLVC